MADSRVSGASPLDLSHLATQTGGDRALEREVLALFLAKSVRDLASIKGAPTPRARSEAAHGLSGSARAIGAGEVARLAGLIERSGSPDGIEPLRAAVDAVRASIAEWISRS